MWMDAYVQQTLIRQQIDESNRTAALRHLVRAAESARARRPWWPSVQRLVRGAVTSRPRRPAARVAVR
jgi:hypothetical protein